MIIVGIDIGGTFTDIVLFDSEEGGIVGKLKVLSTPRNPLIGVREGLEKIGNFVDRVDVVVHATTIATNALLGQEGLELPRTALITTKGFRDVLEIGRQRRPEIYNLYFEKPKVLIPRRYRLEINERTLPTGKVLAKPSEKELEKIVRFIEKEGIESIAISFLHSYVNPENERFVAQYLKKKKPEIYISISSEVDNQYREFERTSTTVINALLMPLVSRYVENLRKLVQEFYSTAEVVIMKSDGGVGDPAYVSKRPVSIIESGPAAGVVATKLLGDMLGEKNIISFDMGGTTAKAGIIISGNISIITEYEVGGKMHSGRIIKGSGYPVRYPFIDLVEVSAGGGSIIWVDEAGAIKVGPISAGSDPGPACYGRGGSRPTITDAHLVLGRLDEKSFLYGEFRVYKDLAFKAFRSLGDVGLTPEEIAIGAIKIADFSMAKILRIITVERGLDPREFALVAFGGGGPMHACPLAEELSFSKIIIPISPGVFSAFGLAVTNFKYSYLAPVLGNVHDLSEQFFFETIKQLEGKAINDLSKLGFKRSNIILNYYADMRYSGQGYELLVSITPDMDLDDIARAFEEKHRSFYGYVIEDADVQIVNLRLEAVGLSKNIRLRKIRMGGQENPGRALIGKRTVFFECTDDFLDANVFRRDKLLWGDVINGPAVIEDYDSTIIIDPLWRGIVDQYGNILLEEV